MIGFRDSIYVSDFKLILQSLKFNPTINWMQKSQKLFSFSKNFTFDSNEANHRSVKYIGKLLSS